jgi:hypothetical protein
LKLVTLNISYEANGTAYFTKKDAQKILSIYHHHTFNAHLKTLDLAKTPLRWAEIKEILSLKLFLYARLGYHTRAMYWALKEKGQLPIIFRYYNIDVDTEFRRIQHDYYERQRQTQERAVRQRPAAVVLG